MIGVDNKEAILFSSTKKIVEQAKKEYEQFKITNSEMDKKIENAENYIKENATKLEIFKNKFEAIEVKMKELESFKKESEARFIKINNWRYFLIETSLPLLIGCFAVFALENL